MACGSMLCTLHFAETQVASFPSISVPVETSAPAELAIMWRVPVAIFLAAQISFAQATAGQSGAHNQPTLPPSPQPSTIVLPAGTPVQLVLTAPLWAKSAKPGESIYAQTAFPVVLNNQMAIPAGTTSKAASIR